MSIWIRQRSNVQNDQITGEVSAIYFIYEYILFRLPPTLVNTYHHFLFFLYIEVDVNYISFVGDAFRSSFARLLGCQLARLLSNPRSSLYPQTDKSTNSQPRHIPFDI